MRGAAEGRVSEQELEAICEKALADDLRARGGRLAGDHRREQLKPSFVTYPVQGLPFADGHTRQLPALTEGPFRRQTHAGSYLERAQRHATRPIKQAVISASALSRLYPAEGVDGYSRDDFLADLLPSGELLRQFLDLNNAGQLAAAQLG